MRFLRRGYETTLDNLVEVTTVSPRLRKIAAHKSRRIVRGRILSPDLLEFGDRLPADVEKLPQEVTLETVDLPPGERAILSLQVPEGTLIVCSIP